MVGFAILGFLLAMMFSVYRFGASAWKKGESQNELLQQAQVVTASLAHEVERSVFSSASVDPGPTVGSAIGMLNCWNSTLNRYEYDATAESQVWQRYVIFYHDAASNSVRRTETPLSPPSTTSVPLPGLAGHRTGGRQLALDASMCEFELSDQLLRFEIELERKRYGSEVPEKVTLSSLVYFRN